MLIISTLFYVVKYILVTLFDVGLLLVTQQCSVRQDNKFTVNSGNFIPYRFISNNTEITEIRPESPGGIDKYICFHINAEINIEQDNSRTKPCYA